jgi:hypothetical protein
MLDGLGRDNPAVKPPNHGMCEVSVIRAEVHDDGARADQPGEETMLADPDRCAEHFTSLLS